MHSSRMRTGRSLTVCWSLLPGEVSALRGGVYSGGCLLWGVSALRGVCSWGVSALGGVCSGGCLLPEEGVCSWGVSAGGVSAHGGVCSWGVSAPKGCIPACTEVDPPPPLTESQTPVKTLPWPNFVAAGHKAFGLIPNTTYLPQFFAGADLSSF